MHRVIDIDMAAILYTSGSTGQPKGVVLSHRNMVSGAASVAEYLGNTPDDRLLAVLPFSFDYGFSQLTTAFLVGASVSLIDHLFARDVVAAVEKDRITGLAAVPPLWIQLADLQWPSGIDGHLRYITNSGGRMPRATLDKLRAALPRTRPFLMYGLTEAFRGTYLPPEELDRRPDSMGKAIPNAEILVVRPDGTPCAADEPGELVQRGALVALGYWNDPAKTAERFKPVPAQRPELPLTEMAVWSGDTVRRDADGFLYFVGRRDEMIKTSGYRVSPTEVEEVVYASGLVGDAVAVAAPHPALGEGIVLIASPPDSGAAIDGDDRLLAHCRAHMPTYMVPHRIEWLPDAAAQSERQVRPARARGPRSRQLRQRRMSLDVFSQHAPLPWFDAQRRRARHRRPADLRDRRRGRTHAALCLRSRRHDAQGRAAASRSSRPRSSCITRSRQIRCRRRATSGRPRRRSRRRLRTRARGGARHRRRAQRHQLRRPGKIGR